MSVVHVEVKLTAKVPRVLFRELIENVPDPPALIPRVVGDTCRLTGAETVIVVAMFVLTVMVAVVPPFFLIDFEDGLTERVQPPGPVPDAGGPSASLPTGPLEQSKLLSWTPLPPTTVVEDISELVLTGT